MHTHSLLLLPSENPEFFLSLLPLDLWLHRLMLPIARVSIEREKSSPKYKKKTRSISATIAHHEQKNSL
jgi:hypothetical protein